MKFDDEVGGAITEDVQQLSTEPVARFEDYDDNAIESLYRDLTHRQEFDMGQMQTFISNLEQTPRNLEPFSSYEYMYQYEHDDDLTHNLKSDTTGLGADKDPHHVQRMIYKSLEQHPEVLSVYLKGKV